MKSIDFPISCLLLGLVLFPFQQSGEAATNPRVEVSSSEKALRGELQHVEQALHGLLERTERRAAVGRESEAVLRREVERFRTHLRFLEARIHGLNSREVNPLLDKLHSVEKQVKNLALAVEEYRTRPDQLVRLAAGYRPAATPSTQPPGKEEAPTNDDCRDALPIGEGTFAGDTSAATNDGEASCGLSGSAPDVWFRYSIPVDGLIFANTLGSSTDTVLSVHTDCPGTQINELTCNDNATGIQSAIDFNVSAGEDYLIRVAGFAGGWGPFTLNVAPGGAISGTVTDTSSDDPILFITVDVWNENGYYVNTDSTDSTGKYTIGGLAAGTYFVSVSDSSNYVAEVYDDLPCRGDSCDPTSGVPVEVSLNSITADIDFALDLAGSISGTVTDAATGEPIQAIAVQIRDTAGSHVESGYTDYSGNYLVGGLAAGIYYANSDSPGYLDELYEDLPCPGGGSGGCDPATGTPIEVSLNSTTQGIDFALHHLGAVSGTVTNAVTGDPIQFVDVAIWDAGGSSVGSGQSDSSGNYTVGGLAPGTFFATTSNYSNYLDELYDGLLCPSGGSNGCDPTTGTAIEVSVNSTTQGIDFALHHLGAISGTVTNAVTGDPIQSVAVEIWAAGGFFLGSGQSDSAGNYTVEGLAPGTCFATTSNYSDYLDELYDDLPCPFGGSNGCDPTTGTAIKVSVNSTTQGIDFALDHLGAISGNVTEAATGEAFSSSLRITVWDASGSDVASYSDWGASYTVSGLAPGTYFATANSYDHQRELYDDLPCPPRGSDVCDPTTGTPIEVSVNSTTSGIDFALDRLGVISGTVTEAATGDPVVHIGVAIWDRSGILVDFRATDGSGSYTSRQVAGTYFAATVNDDRYVGELYDDLPCPDLDIGDCDPTTGTPIVVSLNATTSVDFALQRLGVISGTVTDAATGIPAPAWSVWVVIWDASGSYVGSARTVDYSGNSGNYTVEGLSAGTYFATTSSYWSYVDRLYDDLPCPGGGHEGCDPTTGTPIAVSLNATIADVDFALEPLGAVSGTVTDAVTGDAVWRIHVAIWAADGSFVASDRTDEWGYYTVEGLSAGSHFATTVSSGEYLDELYDGLPCPGEGFGTCDPTAGTPIAVGLSATTAGIDFALDRGGTIAGSVTDAETGIPIPSLKVEVWDAAGSYVGSASTDTVGRYTLGGLSAGGYFVTTRTYSEYHDELYGDLPCPGGAYAGCDPTAGTAVAVSSDAIIPGIDFALSPFLAAACEPTSTVLCLNGDRFRVETAWRDFEGNTGSGEVVPYGSDDSGLFWFFAEDNWEMLVKVLDGCGLNDHFWLFSSAVTNVEYTLRVTDTLTGSTKSYFNPLGNAAAAVTDTGALATCSGTTSTAIQDDVRPDSPSTEGLHARLLPESGPADLAWSRSRFRGTVDEQEFHGSASLALPTQAPLTPIAKMTAADSAAGDGFGAAVAISGDTVVVGAEGDDDGGEASGSAYVFRRNQGGSANWEQVAKMTAGDPGTGDWFGYPVAISGDTVVIGAYGDDDGGRFSGSAYVFQRHRGGSDNWGQVAKINSTDIDTDDQFGYSVAISGDTVVIGAPYDHQGWVGSVYVFERNKGGPDNWGQVAKINATRPDIGGFGHSVAISDDTVVVGALYDYRDWGFGSVSVFGRNQGGPDNWGQVAKMTPDAPDIEGFGQSVAISGDTVVVGAYGNIWTYGAGSVYVFERHQGGYDNWGQVAEMIAPDNFDSGYFGYSVGLSGDALVVGSVMGAAYLFERNQGGAEHWGQVATINDYFPRSFLDYFGWSVAISGDTVVVGAPGDDDGGYQSGSAGLLRVERPTVMYLNHGRFKVEVDWLDFQGNTDVGQVVPFGSDDSGLFWFFDDDNWEMLVKVLDGCAVNDHFWVFFAATTNVEYTLRVTDTETGTVKTYFNPLGTAAAAGTDSSAFATCP
ncbi:MAG: hypothetical protein GY856_55480 [bacterium]|nr:hypothetical protein [bacterium]